MTRTTRRGVLAAMGIAATAGCGSLQDHLPGSESQNSLRGQIVAEVSRTVTLEKDAFEAVPMTFDRRTVLLFSVVADADVDVLTFRREDFQKYKNDATDQLHYVDELSDMGTAATAMGAPVSKGKPVVVVDNTTWAPTRPVDGVTVELDLEAFERPRNE